MKIIRALVALNLLLHGMLVCLDASAATLREILEKNGRDYVLSNSSAVATQLDERDKFSLARMLMRNLRGGERRCLRVI